VLYTWCALGAVRRAAVIGGVLVLAIAAAATSCSIAAGHVGPAQVVMAEVTRPPSTTAAVLSGPPAAVAAGAATRLFASAAVVVLASPRSKAGLALAVTRARRTHAPLLLISARRSAAVVLRAETRALAVREVLATGTAAGRLAADLPGVRVITDPARLPVTKAPGQLSHVVLLVRGRDKSPGTRAAVATALAAGAQVIPVHHYDPRVDPAAIKALADARPRQVLAVGDGFGPARLLASRVAVAATGVQLPAGGQVLFPMHRLLALYGHPGAPALGALGQQGLTDAIARIRRIAAAYQPLSSVPVVPAFEIIATVAEARPGPDGSYSYESAVNSLRPWVRRAIANGMYVVLDLQPGRASLIAQARRYRQLLRLPDVGLALDPEWKLGPRQLPLHQIGHVDISEVNRVIRWLASLTAQYHLPQKLLVLHQFKLSMISDEQRLDTGHDDLALVVHMDGQGTPASKLNTWNAVVRNAPPGVFLGWKNFYDKDHPTLSPLQTMANNPEPVMISYQ